ncbi:hypothetical protein Metlim_1004 [Methanoplanus limicola DSM 2279]|uniref:Uncharacterized protein n=1 Tax=Methanoplanus limicola DSM 2279 TaxID=937775 RepID=H1YZA2_9EURY|nr:hypothetical protein Metlim_1004 [Methanoplanus limicola DSM 2279]
MADFCNQRDIRQLIYAGSVPGIKATLYFLYYYSYYSITTDMRY